MRASLNLVPLVLSCTLATAQPPAITHIVPAAVRPGQSVDVTIFGQNLAGPTAWWTSFPTTAALAPGVDKNGTQADRVVYRVTVPANAALGIGGLRLGTGNGASNLRLLMVDDLASAAETADHQSIKTAQPINLPVAVDAATNAEASDFYRFAAVAGQRVSVEVVARRLGSPVDPLVRLLDAAGRELASADDEPGLCQDCRLEHRFRVAGDYLLEVRDNRYQGGDRHRYRLRVGDFPLYAAPFPLAVKKGAVANVQLCGPGHDGASLVVSVPKDVPGERLHAAAPGAKGFGSGFFTLVASDLTEQLETEPNDILQAATPFSLPGAVNGRLERPGDRDVFAFDGKSGQRWQFVAQARPLGSRAEPFLRLFKPDGVAFLEVDGAGSDSTVLDATLPADGTYRLMVEDSARRGGPGFVYRLVAQPYRPGFALTVEGEKFDAPHGGVFVAKVTAARRDYNGPITLALEGAGEGITLADHVIPEGKPETLLRAALPASLAAGQMAQMRIVGSAKIGDSEFRTVATNLPTLRKSFAELAWPPAELEGLLGLGVGPVFPSYFQLASAAPTAVLQQPGTAVPIKVQVTRTSGFDDRVALAAEGLPDGVTAKTPAIEKGKAEAPIELTLTKPLPPGKHPLRIVGSAVFQNQPQQVVLEAAVEIKAP